jgi:exonuclease III
LKRFLKREKFDGDLRRFLFDLKSVTPVGVTGDFKVAAAEIDAHPSFKFHWAKIGDLGMQPFWIPLPIDPDLRSRFKGYLFDGFFDALTFFRAQSDIYTCWPMSRATPGVNDPFIKRQKNIG